MRRWLELVLVLAVVALAVRFTLPLADSPQPAKVEERAPDPLGGYRIVGGEPREGTFGFLDDPRGGYSMSGRELALGESGVVLTDRDSRPDVLRVLGKPVGVNSENSKWGYWTRSLPNPTMGILIEFDRQDRVRWMRLHTDWSRLAVELAEPSK